MTKSQSAPKKPNLKKSGKPKEVEAVSKGGSSKGSETRSVAWSHNLSERKYLTDEAPEQVRKPLGDSQEVKVQAEWEQKMVEERRQSRLEMLEDLSYNYKMLFYDFVPNPRHESYKPKNRCFFNEACANSSKIKLPGLEGSPRGIEKLNLLHNILKGLEDHFTEYHKIGDGVETQMLKQVISSRSNIVADRIDMKRRQDQEAKAKKEAELERQLEREESGSHRLVLRQRIAKSAIK